MKAWNILMVLDSMAGGGTETYVLSVSKAMRRQGAQVTIAGGDGILQPVFRKEFPTYVLPFNWSPAQERIWVNHLSALMLERNINLVHAHQTPSGRLAAMAAKSLNIPTVFTIHGTYYPKNELVPVVKLSSAVISVSKPVQSFWQREGVSSQVIPNGIDLKEFTKERNAADLRNELGIPEEAKVLLYASRLAWQKGQVCKAVLRSAKDLRVTQYPNLEVVVVGDGPEMSAIRELTKHLEFRAGGKFIHLIGQRTNMPDWYRMSDCVVGTGRVALEAMACGKPVLALGSHGFFGWVEPAVYAQAWDCYFGDHQSIRSCTQPLLTESLRKGLSNPAGMERIGELGRAWVASAFDIEKVSRSIGDVYHSVLR